MYAILPAAPTDAAHIRDIKMRACFEPAFQRQGIGAALLSAIEQAHPAVDRFELTTNTLVPGNVAFYARRGYRITELTQYTGKIVLAQMRKVSSARST